LNSIGEKIIKLDEVSENSGDSVVLCHGHFNIIHPGHIRYLDYASQHGSKLVVSIQGDASFDGTQRKHHFSESERAAGVASLEIVDQVILLGDGTLEGLIRVQSPQVLVLGKEFEIEHHAQLREAIDSQKRQGGTVLYHAGEAQYASSDLLRDSQSSIHEQRIQMFKQACKQQGLNFEELQESIEKFKCASLLVIGDTIVDQYVACDALGMSAEAPIVVVRELDSREYIGGGAIVAMHAKALGAQCSYLSVVGRDPNAAMVARELESFNVEHFLVEDNSRPTTFKIRYMVENQKMFRVSRLKEHTLPKSVEDQIITELRRAAMHVRGILISDFVYGIITPRVLETVAEVKSKHHLLLFGDLQCSSQVGNISKFKNFNLLCPTEREARIALGTQDKGLEWVANTLMDQSQTKNLVLKLGGDGFISYETKTDGYINRQHFPALNVNPVDVTGAGDSLLAAHAVGLCSGSKLMQSSAIGAGMAFLAVRSIGNIPVSIQELKSYLHQINLHS